MNEFGAAELSSAHDVKVLLCYLLEKLKDPVTEDQLYEIVIDSGVINYFHYTEAMESLVKNNSIKKISRDGKIYIELEEKGRSGADYFNDTIPYYFRKQLLKSALYYFAELRHKRDAEIGVVPLENGCEVNCRIKDADYDLMRLSLYAPDEEQAELVKSKIMLDPVGFYRKVIGYALENEEEKIDIPDE